MIDQKDIKKLILEKGNYGQEENLRIYNKFFSRMPLNLVIPLEKYGLQKKRVLDVGCTYGNYLIYFGEGSQGVDVNNKMIDFGRAIGLDIISSDVDKEINVKDNYFDAIWCSNLVEHVESPHQFLRKLYSKLKFDGLLFIKAPLIPNQLFSMVYRIFIGKPGYRASEHLYAYTKKTLGFIIERAGFEIIESNIFWPPYKLLNKLANPLLAPVSTTITIVARKKDSFAYAEKRPV